MEYFVNSRQHLLAELERIDLLIRVHVAQVRKIHADDEQFRGLYITEQEVDVLLDQPIGRPYWLSREHPLSGPLQSTLERLSQQINQRKQRSFSAGIELRLDRLQQLFDLDRFEVDVLLICMAVELDLRYERLYAYLQDDVTKKKPSVDLVLNLLLSSVERKLEARQYFAQEAPLFRHQLLKFSADPSQPNPPLLGRYLQIDYRVMEYLLDHDDLDDRIWPYLTKIELQQAQYEITVDIDAQGRLSRFIQSTQSSKPIIIHLKGPYGAGKQSTAESICHEHGHGLLVVDLERLLAADDSFYEQFLRLANREALLQDAVLYWKGFDTMLGEQHKGLFSAFLRALDERLGLAFLAGETSWEPAGAMRGAVFVSIELLRPTSADRSRLWHAALVGSRLVGSELDLVALASKFKFTGGQIRDAAATAQNLARWRDPETAQIISKDLYEACRLHSNQNLSKLARKITPHYRWSDIVLPPDRLAQLREICDHVKYRERVYEEWGFNGKLALGKGLSVLFAGPSGTGKTMAADIIAGELGLDLYKIDLSTVVSKYIGETEKNLSRIFAEAETSNAILFFDEADALFGKRSEVKDSHDRYANIEIGYLLQRMEEYQGVVILATNYRKNMDEAFVRRLHFTVEFPFPNKEDRRRIWEGIWPENTPRNPNLDLGLVARRFEITGGSIRNIALAAAFMAADAYNMVEMSHVLRATQREYQKMGKVIMEKEFKAPAN